LAQLGVDLREQLFGGLAGAHEQIGNACVRIPYEPSYRIPRKACQV
jgi:hypothetical protein